jgi:peroxiredoxin (alkyl hydroperoxide reductase subunit C)
MNSLVGKKAPKFVAPAVVGGCEIVQNFSLEKFLGEKYVVLFFYPKDFTFVCPTEIWAFQDKLAEFERRGVALVACSTDSDFVHLAWLSSPRSSGGIGGVTFPIVSDINKTIADDYGVLAGEYADGGDGEVPVVVGEMVALRGLFLIDRDGVVQHCVINNMSLGRSVDEALRMVDALQHFEKFGEVCPANWQSGTRAMKPTQSGLREYFN